jgi:methanogenic corrinoid protein MtbC1
MQALHRAGLPAALAAESALIDVPVGADATARAFALSGAAQALFERTVAYDEAGVARLIEEQAADGGWARALADAVFPALVRVGQGWEEGELSPAQEHFLSNLVVRALHSAIAGVPAPVDHARRLLIACPDGEQHELGLLALTLLLRERGARCFYLGAAVPPVDIVAAVTATHSDIVCVSAVTPTSLPQVGLTGRALIAARSPARLFVGGPALAGVRESIEVPGVRLPSSLSGAVDVLLETPLVPRHA